MRMLLSAALILLAAPSAFGVPPWLPEELPEDREAGREVLAFRTRFWMTRGSVDTRYQIAVPPEQVIPRGEVWYGQTWERGAKGLMVVYSAEFAPLRFLSLEAQYGKVSTHGDFRLHSWVHAPDIGTLTNLSNGATWSYPDHEDDVLAQGDQAGRSDWAAVNLYLRVLQPPPSASENEGLSHSLDLAVGAERYRSSTRATNYRRTASLGKFFPKLSLRALPGFDSTYEARWQGPHLGLREEVRAPHGISFEGSVFWSPFMEYRGDGYYNFSVGPGELRAQSPNYTDSAHGTAIHFQLGLAWEWSILRLEAGYQRFYFYSRTGTEEYYYYDGSVKNNQLNFATADLGGMYTGVSIRF